MKKLLLTAVSMSLLAMNAPAQADEKLAKEYKDKAVIEEIVKDYILNNPKIVVDALSAYETIRTQEEEAAAKKALIDNKDKLYNDPDAPSAGADNANVTIVEFFDYNCGYCKRALGDVVDILNEDDNLRVVFKEVPILSDSSREAAKWALASKKQGKYFDYHVKLMDNRGQLDEANLEKLAKEVGLDVAQLKKDKDSEAVNQEIEENIQLMRDIGVRGTPSFVIGETLARGYVGKDALKGFIAGERAK